MKITSNRKSKITAAENLSRLERQLNINLTDDICEDIVNIAYSEDALFEDKVFIDAENFWDIHANDNPQDIVLKFFNGEDMDSKGQANPNRAYFRINKYDNIESTDYPGEIYLDELDDEIVDYVMEHLDDREFPDEIQKIIDKYFDDKE